MGDRANVFVREDPKNAKTGVYLYTHWSGHKLPLLLQAALKKRERWDDPQYLSRVIFQEMIGEDKGCTGFGISARIGDGGYGLLVVDPGEKSVTLLSKRDGGRAVGSWSMDDFCELRLGDDPWAALGRKVE